MTDENTIKEIAMRQATQNLESAMIVIITHYERNRQELESLASELYDDSFCDLFAAIFDRGLEEIRTMKAVFREAENDDRSEKDCLWEDACE